MKIKMKCSAATCQ